MQFQPKSESECNRFAVREPGQYPFTVNTAEDTQSHAGNDMIALRLEVFDKDGKTFPVRDWVLAALAYKLRHFAYSIGCGAAYEAGTLTAGEVVGKSGRLMLDVEEAEGDYPQKNIVTDYVKLPEAQDAKPGHEVVRQAAKPATKATANPEGEIPF